MVIWEWSDKNIRSRRTVRNIEDTEFQSPFKITDEGHLSCHGQSNLFHTNLMLNYGIIDLNFYKHGKWRSGRRGTNVVIQLLTQARRRNHQKSNGWVVSHLYTHTQQHTHTEQHTHSHSQSIKVQMSRSLTRLRKRARSRRLSEREKRNLKRGLILIVIRIYTQNEIGRNKRSSA